MSQAELNGELFTLERFPPNAEEEALQAWEAADEYLLQQVNDVDGLTLIFNDGFGALACALAGLFLFFSDGAFFRALERLAHTPSLLAGTLVSLVLALFFIFHKHK